MPACCPSPVCVHYWCPPNPARRPGPGVQPSGVQPVQCPVIWLPGPDAAVRPAGVQPVRRPAVWWLSVRPVAAVSSRVRRVVAMGETSIRRAAVTTGSSRVPCGPARPRAARSTARGAWMRAPLRRSCAGRRGSVGRRSGPGGASAGGCTRATGQARPPPRAPVAGDCAGAGEWLARGCRTAPCGAAIWLEPRLRCVVMAEPDVRMDGPGRTQRARRRGRRAAPARPSRVASATSSTPTTP
jgi:hypothetical protein